MNLNSPNAFDQYQNEQNEKSSHSSNRSLNSGEQQLKGFEQGDEDALHNLKEIEEQLQSIQWSDDTPSQQLFSSVQPWKSAYI